MKSILFYDGTCPLCAKEIKLLKHFCSHQLEFADIHYLDHDLDYPSRETLLRRLHVKRADGEWLIGLDANVYAWSHSRFGKLFMVLRLPPIRHLADSLYNRWADRRFKKRYECNNCVQ